jgi:hypothetical protein
MLAPNVTSIAFSQTLSNCERAGWLSTPMRFSLLGANNSPRWPSAMLCRRSSKTASSSRPAAWRAMEAVSTTLTVSPAFTPPVFFARGRAWLDEIVSGTASIEGIAACHKCSVRQVNMTISMAFIAPALVKAAVEGRLPRGIGIATFRDAPAEWSLQFERLGLAQP